MNDGDPLPDDYQRRQICELIYAVFLELRYISHNRDQVEELAYAFHNLPLEMYGWGTWDVARTRGMLARYQNKYPSNGVDYVAMFDAIYPDV